MWFINDATIKKLEPCEKKVLQLCSEKNIKVGNAWYRKSRANFRCEKCEKDVTLEIMLLCQSLSDAGFVPLEIADDLKNNLDSN